MFECQTPPGLPGLTKGSYVKQRHIRYILPLHLEGAGETVQLDNRLVRLLTFRLIAKHHRVQCRVATKQGFPAVNVTRDACMKRNLKIRSS
eukprot:scaffold40655_cov16-Prasinocladus_malaysianus.AAC.2